MSHRHEQKYLLHNWSDRRYRDHPQSPRAVLRVRLDSGASATKRTNFVAAMAHLEGPRAVCCASERKAGGHSLDLKDSQATSRLCSVGQQGAFASSACLRSFVDLLMFAAAEVLLF
jgi:hypothetical protein